MARKERRWLWHKASLSSINADPETCASSSAQFVTQRGSSERRGGGDQQATGVEVHVWRQCLQCGVSVGPEGTYIRRQSLHPPLAPPPPLPPPTTSSGAAGTVYDQCDVNAVHLQQVHQEGAVALRVQAHGPDVVGSQGGVHAAGHVGQSLEDAVVQLHEEPATETRFSQSHRSLNESCYLKVTFLSKLYYNGI